MATVTVNQNPKRIHGNTRSVNQTPQEFIYGNTQTVNQNPHRIQLLHILRDPAALINPRRNKNIFLRCQTGCQLLNSIYRYRVR